MFDIGAACYIGHKPLNIPRSVEPRVYPIGARCLWTSPVAPSGKRKPLRAIPWRQLTRQFWSKGLVAYADSLERAQARELTLHERAIATMTVDELEATQHLEPLTESKRSYLTRGEGVLPLDKAEYDWNAAALHNNFGSRVAYDVLDPITAKQIAWEQDMQRSHEVTIVAPAQRKATRPKMAEKQALALGRKFEAFVRNEVDRMMSLDDAIMHGSYEYEAFDAEGNRVILTHLHSPRGLSVDDQKNGPWHGRVSDRSEVGIGYMDSPEDWEQDAGSHACDECGAGTLPAHSNITSGGYEGMLFCSNEDCDAAMFDPYYNHQFDVAVRRLEAGAAA